MSYADQKRAREIELIRSIHGSGIGDEPRPTTTPDFDGGVRPPAPGHRSPPWYRGPRLQLPEGWEPVPED